MVGKCYFCGAEDVLLVSWVLPSGTVRERDWGLEFDTVEYLICAECTTMLGEVARGMTWYRKVD